MKEIKPIPSAPLPPSAMDALACPTCQAALVWQTLVERHALFCRYCHCTYPNKNGALRLRAEDATPTTKKENP